VPCCCGAKVRLLGAIVSAGCASETAVSNGCCHRPRPYVPARSRPSRPSPVGVDAGIEC
jgi:hypothetical protein